MLKNNHPGKKNTPLTQPEQQNKKPRKFRLDAKEIIGLILFLSLLFSIVFTIIRYINAPETRPEGDESIKIKSDYQLMLVQCILGIVVMFLPSIVQKKFKLAIPGYMFVLYFIFLYCAIYLGEVRNFYYAVPHWDTMLHAFSGTMLGALGFTIAELLSDTPHRKVELSPFFIAFFGFCFAVAAGAIWEIYEYTIDSIMKLNMQKYAFEDGTLKVGRAALNDTMKDIIVDVIGALIMAVIGYIFKKRSDKLKRLAAAGEAPDDTQSARQDQTKGE